MSEQRAMWRQSYPLLYLEARHDSMSDNGGLAPCIFNLATEWRWVVKSSFSCFLPDKEPLSRIE